MPSRSKYAVAGVLVALLAGLFVWRYGDTTAPADPSTRAAEEVRTGWRKVDDVPLDAVSRELPGVAGAPDGIPRRGTYLVNIWASSCGPCRHEMPWLERLSRTGEVRVLGVTRDNVERYAVAFLRRASITYPNVRDELGDFSFSLADVVPAQYLPSTMVVVDGKVTWAHLGPFRSYRDLQRSVADRV
jgi:thiol-disulfide isomerase/thioredoxin